MNQQRELELRLKMRNNDKRRDQALASQGGGIRPRVEVQTSRERAKELVRQLKPKKKVTVQQ